MKLIIGLPTAGKPTKPFLESLKSLRVPAVLTWVDRVIVTGNFVPGQREFIMRQAQQAAADFVLMIDDDMVIPSDAIELLYDSMQRDQRNAVTGALYYSRDGKRPMVVSNWHSTDTTEATVPAFTTEAPVPVDGIGFGCVLIRMSALATLQQPYFSAQIVVETAHAYVRICNEDYLLCERFRQANFNVLLDARVRSGHYDRHHEITFPLTWEPNAITSIERMHVRQPNGTEELVPLRAGNPHLVEEHQPRRAGLSLYLVLRMMSF